MDRRKARLRPCLFFAAQLPRVGACTDGRSPRSGRRTASSWPSARSSETPKISTSHYKGDLGIIISRINAFEIHQGDGASAEVVDVDIEYSPWSNQASMVQRGEQRGADVDIEGADILVAGGRGLGKAEGFELAEALAKAFGGNSAVAATRAVVDAGWYPYALPKGCFQENLFFLVL